MLNVSFIIYQFRPHIDCEQSLVFFFFFEPRRTRADHLSSFLPLICTILLRGWRCRKKDGLVGRIGHLSRTRKSSFRARLPFSLKLSRTNSLRPSKQPFSMLHCSQILDWHSTCTRIYTRPIIDRCSADTRLTLGRYIDWYVDRHSTDISTDRSTPPIRHKIPCFIMHAGCGLRLMITLYHVALY